MILEHVSFFQNADTGSPLHKDLQVTHFQRCIFHVQSHKLVYGSGVHASLTSLLLTNHLPPPFPPPVNHSSWLFTQYQPLYAHCCTAYCTVQGCCSSLSHARLFAAPWTAAHQASLSFTISRSLLNLMSIESVMPPNRLILCHPLLSCPQSSSASGSFPMSPLFTSGRQSIGVSASASVLPVNIQD